MKTMRGFRVAAAFLLSAATGSSLVGWAQKPLAEIQQDTGPEERHPLDLAMVLPLPVPPNPPEDAVYPLLTADADGDPMTGEHDYVIHFDADALPPAYAFCNAAMSSLVIVNIASVTRLAFSGSGSAIRLPNTAGTTCQDTPYRSVTQPQATSWPPSASLLQ